MTFFDYLKEITYQLRNIAMHPDREAEYILCEVFGLTATQLLTQMREPVGPANSKTKCDQLLKSRLTGIPIDYLLGYAYFNERSYFIKEGVFIPRPETEWLVKKAAKLVADKQLLPADLTILECGFGSGIISIELAILFPESEIHSWDVNPIALDVATLNCKKHGVTNLRLHQGDFFEGSAIINSVIQKNKPFLVVSNPPYIDVNESAHLQQQVQDFEPDTALYGGDKGIDYYVRFLKLFKEASFLGCFEIGIDQKAPLIDVLESLGYDQFGFEKDFQGIDRILWVVCC